MFKNKFPWSKSYPLINMINFDIYEILYLWCKFIVISFCIGGPAPHPEKHLSVLTYADDPVLFSSPHVEGRPPKSSYLSKQVSSTSSPFQPSIFDAVIIELVSANCRTALPSNSSVASFHRSWQTCPLAEVLVRHTGLEIQSTNLPNLKGDCRDHLCLQRPNVNSNWDPGESLSFSVSLSIHYLNKVTNTELCQRTDLLYFK